jgi:hypothetical protein
MKYTHIFLILLGGMFTLLFGQEVKELQKELQNTLGDIQKLLPKQAVLDQIVGELREELNQAKKALRDFQFDEKGLAKTITLNSGETMEGKLKPFKTRIEEAEKKLAEPQKALDDYSERLGEPYENLEETTGKLVKKNNEEAAKVLTDALSKAEKKTKVHNELYFILGKGLAAFTARDALEEVGDFILKNKNEPIAKDVLFYLMQHNVHSNAVPVALKLFDKGNPEIQSMSLEYLKILRHRDCVPPLMEALKKETGSSVLQTQLIDALETITGGTGVNGEQWEEWWKRNKETPLHELRKKRLADASGNWRGRDLDKIRNYKIIVISNPCPPTGESHDFDKIQEILLDTWKLSSSRIKVLPKEEVLKEDLSDVLAILVNCNLYWTHCTGSTCKSGTASENRLTNCAGPGPHNPMTHEFKPDLATKIKKYVEHGGYLFTEDWVLEELLEVNWPDHIYSNRKTERIESKSGLGSFSIDVFITRGAASHPYLRNVWGSTLPPTKSTEEQDFYAESRVYEPVKHHWKVDSESPIIEIDLKKCQVLLETKDPRLVNNALGGAVAVVFGPRDSKQVVLTGTKGLEIEKMQGGRVLHVLSHFKEQQAGDRSLQNILLNFLIEAAERRNIELRKENAKKFK